MAADLHPINVKVPKECHSVLSGLSKATGDEISVIARRALVEFAKKQLLLATMVVRVSRSESSGGDDEPEADISGFGGLNTLGGE